MNVRIKDEPTYVVELTKREAQVIAALCYTGINGSVLGPRTVTGELVNRLRQAGLNIDLATNLVQVTGILTLEDPPGATDL